MTCWGGQLTARCSRGLRELWHGVEGRQLQLIQSIWVLKLPCYKASTHVSSVIIMQAAPGFPCSGAPGYPGFDNAFAI